VAGADLTFDIIARDKASQPLDKIGQSARKAGEDLENIGDRASTGGGKLSGMFAKVGPALAAGAAAAGALAGAALIKGFQAASEREVATDRLAGQLGLSPEKAAEFGEVAGRLYTDAFGTSVADNTAAIRAVWTSGLLPTDATSQQLEQVTAQAMTFADVMGKDVTLSARAAGQMVRTGLAKNGTEAFDILTRMIQVTGDHADDLLDTMVEYSTQFREVGLDGQKALGMISQALLAGARDADTVADAIKEFAIRSKDGSDTSRQAFQDLGLDADKMFRVFAEGGPNADKAMADVIDRLKGMKDPVEQDAAVVALFGTKAEDLQDALFAIDPTTAVQALGDTKGAVDGLGVAYDNNATKAEEFKRRAEQALADLADGILAWAADVAANDEVQQWWSDLSTDMEDIYNKHLPALKQQWADLQAQIDGSQDSLTMAGSLLRGIAEGAGYMARTLMWSADIGAKSMSFFSDHFRTVTMMFIDHAGMILTAAAKAFGWIPGLGGKLKSAKAEFDKFRDRANEALGGISNRTVHVDVTLRGIKNIEEQVAVRLGRREHGGPVKKGHAYIVGEERAEIFVPDRDGTIIPSIDTYKDLASGAPGQMAGTNGGSWAIDYQMLATEIGRAMGRELRDLPIYRVPDAGRLADVLRRGG
jgi:phage-related minor tail protein